MPPAEDRPLAGMRIAVVATDGVEEREVVMPIDAVRAAGAKVEILSNREGPIQAMIDLDRTRTFPVDARVREAMADDYDALLVPGGLKSPDKLRTDPEAVAFVRRFVTSGKPIAAICHGIALVLEAGGVRGRTVTSYPSLRTDVLNAGGDWVDREVQVDGPIVTSRRVVDIPAFCDAALEAFAERRAGVRTGAGH